MRRVLAGFTLILALHANSSSVGLAQAKVVSMEGFCRCQVDAAKEAKLASSDLDQLGNTFTPATLTALGAKNAEYQKRKQACYR